MSLRSDGQIGVADLAKCYVPCSPPQAGGQTVQISTWQPCGRERWSSNLWKDVRQCEAMCRRVWHGLALQRRTCIGARLLEKSQLARSVISSKQENEGRRMYSVKQDISYYIQSYWLFLKIFKKSAYGMSSHIRSTLKDHMGRFPQDRNLACFVSL